MPNVTGHTELVGLMAYPIRHTQSPTTHNLAYDKNGDDVIQLAFEVDNDSLKDAVQSIRALKMLGSNISMPNKTVVHKYLDEVDEAAKLCGAINTVVNLRDENGQVTGKLKGYNTDGMGYWQALTEEGIDFKGMKMVLIGTGGGASGHVVRADPAVLLLQLQCAVLWMELQKLKSSTSKTNSTAVERKLLI